jgi:hypothetical protein
MMDSFNRRFIEESTGYTERVGGRVRGFSGEVNRKKERLESLDQREKIAGKIRQSHRGLFLGIHVTDDGGARLGLIITE